MRTQDARIEFLATLSAKDIEIILDDWELWARADQLPPPRLGADKTRTCPWTTWVLMGGRGAGKTRAGAEWIKGLALGRRPFAPTPVGRIALIGENLTDVRETMIEGLSGIRAVHKKEDRPHYEPSRKRLVWPNGVIAQIFSSEDPESLRGPQFGAAWCDELAKWRYTTETWDMLQFGLRIGTRPRQMVTTTPKPIPLLKSILKANTTIVTTATTFDNRHNLAPGFMETIVAKYKNTYLGRQELDGQLIEDMPNALFTRATIENTRLSTCPDPERIVIAVDPPITAHEKSCACGIIVAARTDLGNTATSIKHFAILHDGSIETARPEVWAQKAIDLYHTYEADALVVEVNQGGDLVETVIHALDNTVPVKAVRAIRGKHMRAEPIALAYERGQVHHIGTHAMLEDEMCNFTPNGKSGGKSPDRLDALVWALTELMKDEKSSIVTPTIRRI